MYVVYCLYKFCIIFSAARSAAFVQGNLADDYVYTYSGIWKHYVVRCDSTLTGATLQVTNSNRNVLIPTGSMHVPLLV